MLEEGCGVSDGGCGLGVRRGLWCVKGCCGMSGRDCGVSVGDCVVSERGSGCHMEIVG